MAANITASGDHGANSSNYDDNITLKLTIVALATSVIAIALSTLQAVLAYLQFDNSEVGRRRCSSEVMGRLWAGKTTREFKWREWRYQVFFEVPVFYTAPPGITVGPLTKTKPKVALLDRVLQRYAPELDNENNSTIQKRAIREEIINFQKHVEPIYKITGTKTSCENTMTEYSDGNEKWANVHTAEDEGCSWVLLLDALQGQEKASRSWDNTPEHGLNHTICYLLQKKRRCWDFMPLNTTKPFATTNICHLVEMMSMLGLVWTEFDVKRADLSAEGNGYMMRSEYMPGLGILARFSRLSKPVHKENRIVPCDEVKRLCFGEVPSIFDRAKENLQVGPYRLENCLKRLLPQLGDGHRKLFLETSENPLVYSSTFELIAMVGKSVHISGSRFRRLPNPCADTWTPRLNIASCLDEFASAIKDSSFGNHDLAEGIKMLFRNGQMDSYVLTNKKTLAYKVKAYLLENEGLEKIKSHQFIPVNEDRLSHIQIAQQNYDAALIDLLDSLHGAVQVVDFRLEELMDEVREVLSLHFATMLDDRQLLKEELASETKVNTIEKILVKFYFEKIYPVATQGAAEEASDKSTTDSASVNSTTTTLSPEVSDKKKAVWLALMFRMWAWLFLHDFNPEDKMIERSDFKNSRLPVYIG